MQIIRNSSFKATPWKNGAGVTHEAIRVPANGGAFRWRVSVAEIGVAGPFSDFAGYSRTMVLLRGNGVRLRIGGDRDISLRDIGDLVEFDGAARTECELLDGPCADFNLIVSKSIPGVKAWVECLRGVLLPIPTAGGTTLVFGIRGALLVEPQSGETVRLDPWDLALLSPAERAILKPVPVEEAQPPLVFFASLDDNSI